MADKYGRRKIFILGNVAMLADYGLMMYTHSYWTMVGCICVMGMLTPITLNIGFTYFMEFFARPARAKIGSLYQALDLSIYAQMVLLFWLVTKYWGWFFMIGLIS
jgi:MFS transporter, putative metabolite:H+ symporter